MKRKKRKHGRPDEVQGYAQFGVLSDKLNETEKVFYARLRARQMFKETTGRELPLEAFKVEKDKAGDYIVTINEEEGNK